MEESYSRKPDQTKQEVAFDFEVSMQQINTMLMTIINSVGDDVFVTAITAKADYDNDVDHDDCDYNNDNDDNGDNENIDDNSKTTMMIVTTTMIVRT